MTWIAGMTNQICAEGEMKAVITQAAQTGSGAAKHDRSLARMKGTGVSKGSGSAPWCI
jgi:hypothetical protein